MEQTKIFIIDKERRDWSKRNHDHERNRREPEEVTRRYLMIVEQPEVRDTLKKELTVYPHESGKDFLFYCVTKPYYRRAKDFVKTIFYKLQKNNLEPALLNQLEVFTS